MACPGGGVTERTTPEKRNERRPKGNDPGGPKGGEGVLGEKKN